MPSARPRKTFEISDSLGRQLNTYALAATAAGVSVLALAAASDAEVVYTETLQSTRAHVPLYIDLNHDGINDFLLRTTYYAGSSYFKVGLSASGVRNFSNMVAGKHISRSSYFVSAASALPAGAKIGPNREFPVHHPFMAEELFEKNAGTSYYSDLGPWVRKGKGVTNKYLGLKFLIHGQVHYGWARVSVTVAHHRQYGDVTATVTGYAYETTPNKPITAGHTTGADVITVFPGALGNLAQGKP
ncbi:MAG TPA: hypothetical protein VMH04_20275 [Candidatus Solibacter sp.]|nr:hypothetical protein [Candidatus Solibacter sp.]